MIARDSYIYTPSHISAPDFHNTELTNLVVDDQQRMFCTQCSVT